MNKIFSSWSQKGELLVNFKVLLNPVKFVCPSSILNLLKLTNLNYVLFISFMKMSKLLCSHNINIYNILPLETLGKFLKLLLEMFAGKIE